MNEISKSRKKRGCRIKNSTIINSRDISRNKNIGRPLFPINIKSLLMLVAEDDDDENRVDIILDACPNHCFIEDARVVAVMDNTVVIKDDYGFKFVCISCICEVIVTCDTLLNELFDEYSIRRR